MMLAAAVALGMSATALAEVKVGTIDMQKAIQTTEAGKKAKKELESEFEKKKKDLQTKESDLKKMSEDLQKKSMVLSDEVRQKKQLEFQEQMVKYRELVGKSQMEIQERERSLTQPIVEKLRKILSEIGEKDGYTVILEKAENSVMWAPKTLDLTDRVVGEFNKRK
ncbi:MAG: OmpH family outer membrane protein [Oligoflexia bacterium]|nr:OmpH family outer membrane protein [Oligoflexia bacterium]